MRQPLNTSQAILALNGGSSSIKFALYRVGEKPILMLSGKLDRVGKPGTLLTFRDLAREREDGQVVPDPAVPALEFLIGWLEQRVDFTTVRAIGHRLVHGMEHIEPEWVTPQLLQYLQGISPLDQDHLPRAIELIRQFQSRHPSLPQLACFDTAFHRNMPRVAQLLPIPRRFDAAGIRRYGFHGLSYAYLMQQLEQEVGQPAAHGRVILAHLGSGASMAAVQRGASIDTSMGFTPAGGFPMGTRPGDLDPGVVSYLLRSEQLDQKQLDHLINHEAGLLGISETSSDMRDLIQCENDDVRAAEAVAVFCYQIKKWIGAFAAALGGLDTLVFSGGIGEHAPIVRDRICQGLAFLGIEIDSARNALNAGLISTDAGPVKVRVIATDEESMIAILVCRMLETDHQKGNKP